MKWQRTADRGSGPGNLLNQRWLVTGHQRYWLVTDLRNDQRYPTGADCFYASMKEARIVAEELASREA